LTKDSYTAPDRITRYIDSDSDMDDPDNYHRFAVTPSGVSPRALPCKGMAIITSTGNEHLENGHISEDKDNRTKMLNKRNAKIPGMLTEIKPPDGYFDDAEILLIGWGSSAGAIKESVDLLRQKDIDAGCLTFSDIWPFPSDNVKSMINEAQKCFSVELNSTSQFRLLIRQQTGIDCTASILKYDGRPLFPEDIVEEVSSFCNSMSG